MWPLAQGQLEVSAPTLFCSVLSVLLTSHLLHPHNAVILLPSPSAALLSPLKAVFLLPALLASPSQAASLRPGFNMEYFKRVRKRPATAADLASLLLALLARALGGPHAWGLNLLQGHIETMDLGAWVPVELVTFVLGRPPSRDDLQWWERLSEDAWDAVEAFTIWLEAEPGNFTFPFYSKLPVMN